MSVKNFKKDIIFRKRFEFGKNWQNFLSKLSDDRIKQSEKALKEMLGVSTLQNKTFLDVGSGSGLSSLAARNLGAKVLSFDYDENSVLCTRELKHKYYQNDNNWKIMHGSVLDTDYLRSLGEFDYVYSWGVLHHTGDMWKAMENIKANVKERGVLFISIYNYQPIVSRYWLFVKRSYVKYYFSRPIWILLHGTYPTLPSFLLKILLKKDYLRGMSIWHDLVDWLGGYPFEFSSPDKIFKYYRSKGFELSNLKTVGGKLGCNEFVFNKIIKKSK